jgi:SAM-dependent methyltransferase
MRTDQDRLRDFWNARYGAFTLSESGWMGAGEQLNELLYRCKRAAVRTALATVGRSHRTAWSVLDAGCGQGYFARFYHDEYPRAAYVGVDISERVIEHVRAAIPHAEFHAADLSQWSDPGRRSFDIVQCVDVMQMVLDDTLAGDVLTNLASLVAPGGSLLVTAPLPEAAVEPSGYLRYRGRAFWNERFAALRLRIVSSQPLYYWLPAGGPANRYLRYAFDRLGPLPLYWADRVALAAGLPRAASSGIECHSRLLTLQRAIEPDRTQLAVAVPLAES